MLKYEHAKVRILCVWFSDFHCMYFKSLSPSHLASKSSLVEKDLYLNWFLRLPKTTLISILFLITSYSKFEKGKGRIETNKKRIQLLTKKKAETSSDFLKEQEMSEIWMSDVQTWVKSELVLKRTVRIV